MKTFPSCVPNNWIYAATLVLSLWSHFIELHCGKQAGKQTPMHIQGYVA